MQMVRSTAQNPENDNNKKHSNRDAPNPQPGEIRFNTMRYRSSETVQRSE